jgi:hypothetical protein
MDSIGSTRARREQSRQRGSSGKLLLYLYCLHAGQGPYSVPHLLVGLGPGEVGAHVSPSILGALLRFKWVVLNIAQHAAQIILSEVAPHVVLVGRQIRRKHQRRVLRARVPGAGHPAQSAIIFTAPLHPPTLSAKLRRTSPSAQPPSQGTNPSPNALRGGGCRHPPAPGPMHTPHRLRAAGVHW